jgi:hypothetical protein
VLTSELDGVGEKRADEGMVGSDTNGNASLLSEPCPPPVIITEQNGCYWTEMAQLSGVVGEHGICRNPMMPLSRKSGEGDFQQRIDSRMIGNDIVAPWANGEREAIVRDMFMPPLEARGQEEDVAKMIWAYYEDNWRWRSNWLDY